VKYDASGNVIWAKRAGGGSNAYGYGISTDADGNVLVTGSFAGSITFGTTTLNTNVFQNSDVFVAKYDASGNVLWAKSAGGNSIDTGSSISTDINGNVYVTGSFSSSSVTFGNITLTNAGNHDIFIVKYDASGNVLWAKSADGTSDDRGLAVSTDAGGNVYVTGYFNSSSITFGTATLTIGGAWSGANRDVFIVKYDASGNMLWARRAGGNGREEARSISTDAGGNVYVTGFFMSSSITFGTTTLNGGGGTVFIVKYAPNGDVLWAKAEGGTDVDLGYGISTDASGNVYVTGSFLSSSIIFGTTTLMNASISIDYSDIFIVKYAPNGDVLWAISAGSTYADEGYGIATDVNGDVYVTGSFASSSITFGNTTLTNAGGVGISSPDVFVAKLGSVITSISEGGTNNDLGFSISPNPATNQLTISTELGITNYNLRIMNTTGQLVYQSAINNQQSTIDVSSFATGTYFIQLVTEQGITTKKFVKR